MAQKVSPVDNNRISARPGAEPAKRISIEEDSASVKIETNVSGVEVYLNGVYMGHADLVLNDLAPGYYLLELRKRGYEEQSYMIRVRRGYDLHYYFQMHKICGTVWLKDVPSNSHIIVENSESMTWVSAGADLRDYKIMVPPGRQEICVKCFGYEPFTRIIDIHPYSESTVYVDLRPAAFELYGFKINKKAFNPDYSGHIGKCIVSFSVTTTAEADVTITSESGDVVWSNHYYKFTTWDQEFEWTGTDSNGRPLEDGTYCVKVEAAGFVDYDYVRLDRSISYPIFTASKMGGSVGEVPVVFADNSDFIMVHFEGGAENFKAPAVSGGVIFNFVNHLEVAGLLGGYPYTENNAAYVNVTFKVYSKEELKHVTLCYGALFRYGLSTDPIPYSEYGYDTGNGIGGGVLFGMDFGRFYAGFASQMTGIERFWTNGVCMSLKPENSVKMSIWGNYTMTKCIRAGAEVCFMPESSAFIINAKAGATIAGSKAFPNVGFGLSYLF